MSGFLSSSIGKKLLMSVSGLFLITFLVIHLTVNLMLLVPVISPMDKGDTFNIAAHFMSTNPIIKIMEPILFAGFILHIAYSLILSIQNNRARPVKYKKVNQKNSSSWMSRNMLVLGALVLAFLVLHMANFYYHIKFNTGVLTSTIINNEEMHDSYTLVVKQLSTWWLAIIYIISAVLLGLHLAHGFWSAFQTIGWSGTRWRKRFEIAGALCAVIFGGGFALIPLLLMIDRYF